MAFAGLSTSSAQNNRRVLAIAGEFQPNSTVIHMTKNLFSIRQFSERNPAFSQSSLRALRFNQSTNGFAPAFLTVGRKILVDESKFFEIIDTINQQVAACT
jgi:hypothetical protein